jgi:hypothetical protein
MTHVARFPHSKKPTPKNNHYRARMLNAMMGRLGTGCMAARLARCFAQSGSNVILGFTLQMVQVGINNSGLDGLFHICLAVSMH